MAAIAAVAFFVCAMFAVPARASTSEIRIWQDGAVPSFALPATDGPKVALHAQRGRVVLVHFFATWCEPCREELPALRRFVERANATEISVVAISVAEVELRVRRFLETMPLNFPVLLDQDRAVAKSWKVSSLPSTVILDRDLKPRFVVDADFAWDRMEPGKLVEMTATKTSPVPSSVKPGGQS